MTAGLKDLKANSSLNMKQDDDSEVCTEEVRFRSWLGMLGKVKQMTQGDLAEISGNSLARSQQTRSSRDRPAEGGTKSAKEETVKSNATISPDALAGFVVGDGCFYVEGGYDKKYRHGWRIRPGFCAEVRYDDREILETLKSALGCGNIYELDFGRYQGYESHGWKPHVKYRVGNFQDIRNKVIPFFRKHPLFGRKRQSFELFCQVVHLMEGKRHLDLEGIKEIKAVVKNLNLLNKKGA